MLLPFHRSCNIPAFQAAPNPGPGLAPAIPEDVRTKVLNVTCRSYQSASSKNRPLATLLAELATEEGMQVFSNKKIGSDTRPLQPEALKGLLSHDNIRPTRSADPTYTLNH